jgi:acetylglutamate kinase
VTLRVIKIGGRLQSSPTLAADLAAAWRREPASLCVVHGGGDEISALQRRLGSEATFAGGRRITSEADVDIVRMVLSGTANKRLVAALVTAGVRAVGVSGEDDGMLEATIAADGALGRAGLPSNVDASLLRALLAGGWLPVISPVAREAGDTGHALNVNGDDAAAAIAAALGAAELLLLSDVPGVLVNDRPVGALDDETARTLIRDGAATGGMAAKLDAACAALARGVPRVRIGDASALSDANAGTTLVSTSLTAVPR